jgi:hypothetical protein
LKVQSFNDMLGILTEDEMDKVNKEINNLEELNFTWEKIMAKNSSLMLWDLISHSHGSNVYHLSKLIKACHTLPTSTASLEQTFSRLKFIKNNLRSNLKEETVQSLVLIAQEYQNCQQIIIPERLLTSYDKVTEELSTRKSKKRRAKDEDKEKEPQVNHEGKRVKKTENTQAPAPALENNPNSGEKIEEEKRSTSNQDEDDNLFADV